MRVGRGGVKGMLFCLIYFNLCLFAIFKGQDCCLYWDCSRKPFAFSSFGMSHLRVCAFCCVCICGWLVCICGWLIRIWRLDTILISLTLTAALKWFLLRELSVPNDFISAQHLSCFQFPFPFTLSEEYPPKPFCVTSLSRTTVSIWNNIWYATETAQWQ